MSEAVAVRPDKGNLAECKWTLKRVDELVKIVNQSYLELCELLFKVKQNEWFRQLQGSDGELYGTFDEYVVDRLGFHDRKGDYFVKIERDLIQQAGLKREELAGVDYHKAYHLSTLPPQERTKEKIGGWIERAKGTTIDDLKVSVNKVRNEAEKGKRFKDDASSTEAFLLDPEQRKDVNLALEVARKIAGTKDNKAQVTRGFLLDLVCMDFLSGKIVEGKLMASRMLKRVEEAFDIRVVAFEQKGEDMEIVYGDKIARQFGLELEPKKKGLDLSK